MTSPEEVIMPLIEAFEWTTWQSWLPGWKYVEHEWSWNLEVSRGDSVTTVLTEFVIDGEYIFIPYCSIVSWKYIKFTVFSTVWILKISQSEFHCQWSITAQYFHKTSVWHVMKDMIFCPPIQPQPYWYGTLQSVGRKWSLGGKSHWTIIQEPCVDLSFAPAIQSMYMLVDVLWVPQILKELLCIM
jgi:hypothetical protein